MSDLEDLTLEDVFCPIDKLKKKSKEKDPTAIYLHAIGKHPLLTAAQEIHYGRLSRSGDLKARDTLINSNLRIVVNIARRYIHRGFALLDLIEEGNLGLIRAVDKFDPELGYRFSTYATWWIRQCIERSIVNFGRAIRLPVYVARDLSILLKHHYKTNDPSMPKNTNITKILGKSTKKIEQLLISAEIPLSLETEVSANKDLTLGDTLEGSAEEDPYNVCVNREIKEQVLDGISRLTEKEQFILNKRYGFDGNNEVTLEALSKDFGFTRERIRQLQAAALLKLQRILNEKGIKLETLKN